MSRLNSQVLLVLCLFMFTTLTKSTVTSMAGTQENVSQECITESEISPEKMVKDTPNCKITDSDVNASSMQWSMKCDQGDASMTGNGQVTSSGNEISGGMNLTANFGGQDVSMSTAWQGKRIGDCE